MKMYDTVAAYAATKTPEEIRKEFEAAMKQYEAEQKKTAAVAYTSRLTEIANRMLNHSETAEDVAFILNTYFTDKHIGYCVTAKELDTTAKWLKTVKDLDDDETISKFLNDILGL